VKVAFSTSGDTLESPLDPRFGRAQKFLVYDTDGGAVKLIDNQQNLEAVQGAGIQAAQTIAKLGVECLVTGHCGPKAYRVLAAAGIKVFPTDAPTVAEALERFLGGRLQATSAPDVPGHW
jgi:predicted Fe-Mo cluster-binding NifX family protein